MITCNYSNFIRQFNSMSEGRADFDFNAFLKGLENITPGHEAENDPNVVAPGKIQVEIKEKFALINGYVDPSVDVISPDEAKIALSQLAMRFKNHKDYLRGLLNLRETSKSLKELADDKEIFGEE